MIESETDRLALLRDLGERFDSVNGPPFFAIFERQHIAIETDTHIVDSFETYLECRSSDAAAHELVRESKLRRLSDGSVYFVKQIEPDGTGMTRVVLKQ